VVLGPNQPPDRFYLGGARIAALRGEGSPGEHVPEDWVASTTTVAGTADLGLTVLPDGRLLRDAVAADPAGWLGPDHVSRHGEDIALLVKLLDAGERLPVHVHPDDDFARSHLGCRNGKTEAWIILSAEPGSRVYLGFRHDVAPEQLASWVEQQDREALLGACHSVEVSPGDTVFVPAGLPHAIGAGILLLELQQAADLSLLLEYAGFAIDGASEGHLGIGFDTALQCVRSGALPEDELAQLIGRWDDPHVFPASADAFFRAQRLVVQAEVGIEPGFSVLVVASGSGQISSASGDVDVRTGSTVVVPYGAGRLDVRGELEILRCQPPDPGS
jgi:mannose-6-phosphate isomerase